MLFKMSCWHNYISLRLFCVYAMIPKHSAESISFTHARMHTRMHINAHAHNHTPSYLHHWLFLKKKGETSWILS